MRALAGLLTALALLVGPAPASSIADTTGPFRSGHGITVEQVAHPAPREWRLTVSTTALARPVHVDVLLPTGYDGDRRYPVLYLFHGTSGGADDWLEKGDAAATTADASMILVMPDAGYDDNGGSWFTDWVDQHTALGRANWETFHVGQLVPWIDSVLRTERGRGERAVAGLSQGGFGAFSYAARHPDRFVAAASFSGAPDVAAYPVTRAGGALVVGATMTGLNGVQPNAPFGDPVTQAANWAAHDPGTQVRRLRDTKVDLYTSEGVPGESDLTDPAVPGTAGMEAILHQSNLCFQDAAAKAGVPIGWHSWTVGTHAWQYGDRSLRDYLPRLMRYFRSAR